MGFSLGGYQSGASVGTVLAALVAQDIAAKSITLSQASGSDAVKVSTNGARIHFGAGASDYASSDGTTVTFAGPIAATGNTNTTGFFQSTAAGIAFSIGTAGGQFALAGASMLFQRTAPTVVAGAGASIVASNGSAAFTINLGGAAQTGTITLPTAATGWVVYMQDITTPASFVFGQTGGTTTTATFTCYSRTTGAAINWTANDILACIALAY